MARNVSALVRDDARSPGRVVDLIRWGPVFAGVIVALGGLLGGRMRRPVVTAGTDSRADQRPAIRDEASSRS